MKGYPINWGADPVIQFHPLYLKYASSAFADIDKSAVVADLGKVLATAETAPVCAYLAWLIRIKDILG